MKCEFCGLLDLRVVYQASETQYGYLKCKGCGVVKTLAPTGMQKYLDESFQNNHRFNTLGEILFSLISFFRFRKLLKIINRKSGKMLDYGCGRGDLMHRFYTLGWQVSGTEYSQETSRDARSRHREILVRTDYEFETIELYEDQEFDLITSFHNLEHLDQPVNFLFHCSRVIKPGGYLVIEVPNYESWQSRLGGCHWLYLDPINHTFHLTKRSLKLGLQKNGFCIEKEMTYSAVMGSVGMVSALINLFTKKKNSFFHQMKPSPATQNSKWVFFREFCFFVVLFPLGFAVEIAAALCNSGAVIRVIAKRE